MGISARPPCRLPWLSLLLLLLLSGVEPPASAAGPIKTVVVLVMENRSFDHMLGWMKQLNPEINGVTGSEWNPLSASDPASPRVYFGDGAHFVDPDPGHSFQAIREQIFGSNDTSAAPPPMNGFVQQARSMSANMTDSVMNGFRPEMVAVYQALVEEFAVFDRWFASVPASTQPNRLYVHSATSNGATSNIARHFPPPSSPFPLLLLLSLVLKNYYKKVIVLYKFSVKKIFYYFVLNKLFWPLNLQFSLQCCDRSQRDVRK